MSVSNHRCFNQLTVEQYYISKIQYYKVSDSYFIVLRIIRFILSLSFIHVELLPANNLLSFKLYGKDEKLFTFGAIYVHSEN